MPQGKFGGSTVQTSDTGGAGLRHSRTGQVRRTHQSGHPWETIKTRLLRHTETQHTMIKHVDRYASAGQCIFGHMGCKTQAVQMGHGPLPASERRAPVSTIWNGHGFHSNLREWSIHQSSPSLTTGVGGQHSPALITPWLIEPPRSCHQCAQRMW